MGRNLFNRVKSEGGKIFHLFWILFLTAGFFILPKIVLASASIYDLVVTEIMYDPEGSDSGHSDWIEIYNPTEEKITVKKDKFGIIDEENLELGSDGVHYKNCHKIDKDLELDAKKFAIIASDKDDFESDYQEFGNDVLDSAFSLSSNGDRLRLSNDKCETFFVDFDFSSSWGGKNNGKTLEKIDMEGKNSKSNWKESYIFGGTPGEKNSEKPVPKEYSDEIRINEILPNPSENESEEEYIELYNFSKENIELEDWRLKDSSKSGEYLFAKDTAIEKEGHLVIFRKDFKFALNNSDESVHLFDPNGKEVDIVSYIESTKEEVSYNFDGQKWRWSRFLTPGNENRFNNLPTSKLKIEKKVYKNMLAEFRVSAKDKDKDKLKFVWDFGDEHKSYKQNTKHKYLKKGVYQVALKISDGSEDIFETFKIEVGSFPKKELKIVGMKANPKGKDTGRETIKIKNNSKKKINLKGWSVATGWKELYNHPINKKFVLKPGETKELTRKYSAFTLNNKQTRIELRRPDGSIASKVKYSKKEGIQDDETYEKTESGWQWIGSQSDIDLTLTNTNKTQTSADQTQVNVEDIQNVVENKEEIPIQDDELAGEEVLGAETVKYYENISDDKPVSGNFFQRFFWKTNQIINNFINAFF